MPRNPESQKQKEANAIDQQSAALAARRKLAMEIIDFLDEKKVMDLLAIDLEGVNPYFGIFLIGTAGSQVQLKSLVREFSRRFAEQIPRGMNVRPADFASGWVILDLIDVVVHLFLPEQREFYNLERLWGDGKTLRDERRRL
ncbi:MAG: ribosome silencing factor [Leptospirales bacterium]|nr:ribosome silencing factor [Leptospirales bacterium]